MRKYVTLCFLLALLVNACSNEPDLTGNFEAYDEVRFQLPKGWRDDPRGATTVISGGFGFYSSDYAGLTYLRLHQGAMFGVMGEWEETYDAASLLQTMFADNVTAAKPIKALGVDGTYAHGTLEQGQGIGAVVVTYPKDGQPRQLTFIATVADEWEKFEETFLKIIASLTLVG